MSATSNGGTVHCNLTLAAHSVRVAYIEADALGGYERVYFQAEDVVGCLARVRRESKERNLLGPTPIPGQVAGSGLVVDQRRSFRFGRSLSNAATPWADTAVPPKSSISNPPSPAR
jgi:hypothetical protein